MFYSCLWLLLYMSPTTVTKGKFVERNKKVIFILFCFLKVYKLSNQFIYVKAWLDIHFSFIMFSLFSISLSAIQALISLIKSSGTYIYDSVYLWRNFHYSNSYISVNLFILTFVVYFYFIHISFPFSLFCCVPILFCCSWVYFFVFYLSL